MTLHVDSKAQLHTAMATTGYQMWLLVLEQLVPAHSYVVHVVAELGQRVVTVIPHAMRSY